MNVAVVIQARTNSSRLPGKVLLPIASYPIAVLAALRASNTGLNTLVVTSDEETDNTLCEILSSYNVRYFRGSLEQPLKRFCDALKDADDDTIVVRLTADNVCPDGSLIEDVVKDFVENKCDYIVCNGIDSGLPYGMSLEVTFLKHLREANDNAIDNFDREHVTPYVRRKYGVVAFDKYQSLCLGHLNCTIDNLSEYLQVSSLFNKGFDPIACSWKSLAKSLSDSSPKINPIILQKFVLGTAQLGSSYGITRSDVMSHNDALSLLTTAGTLGVKHFDTASVYGHSETIIGEFLGAGWTGRVQVVTKIYFDIEELESNKEQLRLGTENKVYHSLYSLGTKSLDCLLLHRYDYKEIYGGVIWDELLRLKENSYIKCLGVSVQSPEELIAALDDKTVEHIQMPYNALDWRWNEAIEKVREVKQARDITIHCRSIYLQGLLLSGDQVLWSKANVDEPESESIIKALDIMASDCSSSLRECLLAFVLKQDWVDGVVIGLENIDQLIENLSVCLGGINSNPLEDHDITLKEHTLNPALWNS